MAATPGLRGSICLVLFAAVLNLSYSYTLRNVEPNQDRNSANGLNTNLTVETPENATEYAVVLEMVRQDDDLKMALLKKNMDLLDKEARVYDLEEQKLELELTLLKRKLNESDTVDESSEQPEATLTAMTSEAPTPVMIVAESGATTEPPTMETTTSGTGTGETTTMVEQGSTTALETTTTTSYTTETATMIVFDEKGSTTFEFLKAGSGSTRSSLDALAVSLIVTVAVLRF